MSGADFRADAPALKESGCASSIFSLISSSANLSYYINHSANCSSGSPSDLGKYSLSGNA